ncbi:MAG TPA: 4-hydroxybenzoate 3-monooxygenase [Povalibacter sp.]|nr:4-hydroxybenzoate 3-monooxygenase [Povalibacter sp.]
MLRTQVAIVGGGPSGLLLAQLLRRNGIDSIVLEQRTREYVEARIRAGLLEQGTVDLLIEAGVGVRLQHEGLKHDGFEVAFSGRTHRIDLKGLTGSCVTIYGQTEIQKDLDEAVLAGGGDIRYGAADVAVEGLSERRSRVSFTLEGRRQQVECDFIAGCDGFHGVCRPSVPADTIRTYERVYPFGWLGILADVPPVSDELVYANHARGFALCSMRSRTRSRYYVQCPVNDSVADWPDERFWGELRQRLPPSRADRLVVGPSIEKSIAPLRSFVAEPMRFGNLFLVGDAAHIVPPTGAKGLNLAAADVRILYQALVDFYRSGSDAALDQYSPLALERVWKATRFSWWFTTLMHRFSDDPFAHKLQLAELHYLSQSHPAAQSLAENYVGLGFRMPA